MFDLAWQEVGIIAVVALIVLGPKELPNALRTVTHMMKNARKLANEFQSGVNEIVREADLEDARKLAQGVSKGSISKAIEKVVDPTGEVKVAVNAAEASVKATGPAAVSKPQPALTVAPDKPAPASADGGGAEPSPSVIATDRAS